MIAVFGNYGVPLIGHTSLKNDLLCAIPLSSRYRIDFEFSADGKEVFYKQQWMNENTVRDKVSQRLFNTDRPYPLLIQFLFEGRINSGFTTQIMSAAHEGYMMFIDSIPLLTNEK
ncbi:MAG: hypothetical protein AAGI23_19430 [Bacteroidota bacterium]